MNWNIHPPSDLGPIEAARAVLSGEAVDTNRDPVVARFAEAARDIAGPADRAVLVRHVLRRAVERDEAVYPSLVVPDTDGWPNPRQWIGFGCRATPVDDGVRISAQPWLPTWLPNQSGQDPAAAVFAEQQRRSFGRHVSADPFLYSLGYDDYLAGGQREAVRAALTAPNGATLLVVLPTGAGKSTIFQALAFADRSSGTVCVIVPTVALALDQDRRAAVLAGHPTAYVGASSDAERARNAQILLRIKNGTQRVVFAAPEALHGALGSALFAAADVGLIRALIVDEAHLAAGWGDSFRPAFQDLAGTRRALLSASPKCFPTILLSATVTRTTRATLRNFFAGPGPFRTLAAVQLRPEPSYWIAETTTPDVRQIRVLEALRHLPRPLILYVLKRKDVEVWGEYLMGEGYRRFATLTGDDSAARRRSVLAGWRRRSLDVVVATSAFGLGVDQSDVRSVVHACLPESLDRFYQEVGRGGRDGLASMSLLVHTPSDLSAAKRIARKKLVRTSTALRKWRALFAEAEPLGGDRYRLSIDIRDRVGITKGSYNRTWNLRTLNLMAQAGLIRLEGDRPPENSDDDGIPRPTRVVDVVHPAHTDQATWERLIVPVRRRLRQDGIQSLDMMLEIARGERCVAEIFASSYTLPADGVDRRANVAMACAGCPAHREPLQTLPLPIPLPPWPSPDPAIAHPELAALLRTSGSLFAVFYPSRLFITDPHKLRRAVAWCIVRGATALSAPESFLDSVVEEVGDVGLPIFTDASFRALMAPARPAVVLVTPGHAVPRVGSRPAILFIPDDASHADRVDRRAVDVWNGPHAWLDAFTAQRGI